MKFRSIYFELAGLIGLLILFSAIGAAQSYRGRVQGIVTDQSQAVIAGATVTLLNVETGVSVVRQSGENGQYLFDLVDPGTYSVTRGAFRIFEVRSGKYRGPDARRRHCERDAETGIGAGQHHRHRSAGIGSVQLQQQGLHAGFEDGCGDSAHRPESFQVNAACAIGGQYPRRNDAVPLLGCEQRRSGRRHQPEERPPDGWQPDRHGTEEQLSAEYGCGAGSRRIAEQRGRRIRPQRRRPDQHDAEIGQKRLARNGLLPGPVSVAQRPGGPNPVHQ